MNIIEWLVSIIAAIVILAVSVKVVGLVLAITEFLDGESVIWLTGLILTIAGVAFTVKYFVFG